MYAKVCPRVSWFFEEPPEDSLGCNVFVCVFQFLFNSGFAVSKFSHVDKFIWGSVSYLGPGA